MLIDLEGKTVVLGISGSIAAYKACELARLYVKSGASVHVIMSPAACRFVTPLTFEALTGNTVLTEETESWSSDLNHIDLGKKADVFIIAPATANTINKMAKGIADTLLLQSVLAFAGDIVVAPAANTNMIQNPVTEGSLKMLALNGMEIVQPQKKLLACGDTGTGALAEPMDIYWHGVKTMLKNPFWENRKVVVTGGGTREAIDSVRFVSNHSSGKMAKALATALYLRGADVCYISTMPHHVIPSEIYTIDVENAAEMQAYVIDAVRIAKKGKLTKASLNDPKPIEVIKKTPYLFMTAAVGDYRPKYPQDGKMKKATIGQEWKLEMVQNPDIVKDLDKNGIVTVAFKAETDKDNGLENARKALIDKGVDAVCYNLLTENGGFGSDDNEVIFLDKKREILLQKAPKLEIAMRICEVCEELDYDRK